MRFLPALLACLVVAGCTAPVQPLPEPVPAPPVDARVLPSLAQADTSVEAPTFKPVAIATGFLGEPTLVATNDALYVTFPGCPDGMECENGPVYRSLDWGKAWTLLNGEDGLLSEDGEAANGDAMLAVDAEGSLYASNLGAGIQVWRSDDAGATWRYLADVVPSNQGADRQWGWAGRAGHTVQAWMATAPTRSVAVAVSTDRGANWTEPMLFEDNLGWLGPIAGSEDGWELFVPYTVSTAPEGSGEPGLLSTAFPLALKVLRSRDAGASWEPVDTGRLISAPPGSTQWSGTLMAPAAAVTGDGTWLLAWSQEVAPEERGQGPVATVFAMASTDSGETWGPAVAMSGERTAIMPWLVGGAGGAFAVAWYSSDEVVADNDYEGVWDVEVAYADATGAGAAGAGDSAKGLEPSEVVKVAAEVHSSGVCARGGLCSATLADRRLLDFLGATMLPDGRLAVAYASTTGTMLTGSGTTLHVAVQEAGHKLGVFAR